MLSFFLTVMPSKDLAPFEVDFQTLEGNDHARIQGQGQEPMKVGNSTILDHFQNLSPAHL